MPLVALLFDRVPGQWVACLMGGPYPVPGDVYLLGRGKAMPGHGLGNDYDSVPVTNLTGIV